MRLALLQAKINDGNTNENPSVGCVLVKNNLVLAAGCTSPGGRPHAEVNVINSIKRRKNNDDFFCCCFCASLFYSNSLWSNKDIYK